MVHRTAAASAQTRVCDTVGWAGGKLEQRTSNRNLNVRKRQRNENTDISQRTLARSSPYRHFAIPCCFPDCCCFSHAECLIASTTFQVCCQVPRAWVDCTKCRSWTRHFNTAVVTFLSAAPRTSFTNLQTCKGCKCTSSSHIVPEAFAMDYGCLNRAIRKRTAGGWVGCSENDSIKHMAPLHAIVASPRTGARR